MPDGAAPWNLDWSGGDNQQQSAAPPPPPWQMDWGNQADQVPPAPAPTSQDVAGAAASQVPAELADVPGYVPTTSGSGQSLAAGVGQGAVTTLGAAVAGPGTAITGTTAAAAANVYQQAQAQLDVMKRIDAGEQVPAAQDPMGYASMSPEQRSQFRAQYEQQAAQMPPPQQSPIATAGRAVGEAVAAPGEWINQQGQKITPPAGYENSISNEVGKNIGALPVYIGSFFAGGPAGTAALAASQTYHDEYNAQIKAGVSPEDAAANAGAKALAAGGLMTLPVARYVETLSGMAKRAAVAALTRAGADGFVMASVGQVQQLANNVIDKATTQPDKDVTQGMFDPRTMAIQAGVGAIPGGVAAGAHALGIPGRPAGGPEGAAEGAAGVAAQPAAPAPEVRAGGEGAAEGPQGPAAETLPGAPTPEAVAEQQAQQAKAVTAITAPPAQDAGGTLIRAADSSGQNWVGHGGVLVAEGHNEAVDSAFRDAEQRQPTTAFAPHDTDEIDRLVSQADTQAVDRVTWTGATTAPDGRAVMQGHDAVTGRLIEIPEERYSVLAQYGDPARDMYVTPGQEGAPLVAVREPPVEGEQSRVLAMAPARPQMEEPSGATTPGPTLEQHDEALANNEPPPLPAQAVAYQQQLDRLTRNGEPTPGTPEAEQATRLQATIRRIVATTYGHGTLTGPDAPGLDDEANLAARLPRTRVPRTQRLPGLSVGDITDRPSLYRQAFRDAGYDPDVMVNRPVGHQIEVLSDHLENTTGLKVTVDPKMQPQKAIDSMLDAYRNAQWMAHALGYPLKAMSLDGKVGLNLERFDPQRPYLGMYDGSDRVIHMPDRSNSFAHEWTHAMDHELMTKLAVNPRARGLLTSSRARDGGLDVNAAPPGNSTEAFAHVMRAIFHDDAAEAARLMQLHADAQGTGMKAKAAAAEAQRIEAGAKARQPIESTEFLKSAQASRMPRYYTLPEEMLARAHEAYVAHQVAQLGGGSEFITKGDLNYLADSARKFANLYPQADERAKIFQAFQDMHAQLQREQALGRGAAAQRPGDYDMLDPVHWRNISNNSNPPLTNALRQNMQRNTSWRQRLMEGVAERMGVAGRVTSMTPSMRALQHVKDWATAHMWSGLGQLETYRDRYKTEGNKVGARHIDNLISLLGYRYGENMSQATPFERRARNYTNQEVNQLARTMEANGVSTSRFNDQTELQWWRALRGRDTADVPPHIMRLASENRAQLQRAWYDLERAGIPVGMPRDEGYVPIIYDEGKMLDDPRQANATIHEAMSRDFDVKQAADSNFIHDAYSEVPRAELDKDVHDAMKQLAQVEGDLRTETDPAKIADLQKQRADLLATATDPVRDAWAALHADNWMHAIDDVKWNDRTAGAGPTASPFKQRVLSSEARDVMEPYIITRPSELLPHYFHTVGRKIAGAERFGTRFQVLDKLMNDLADAGVRKEERQGIAQIIQSSLGLSNNRGVTIGSHGSTWARTLATMVLMGRSAYSSVAEPMLTMAQTGSMRAGANAFGTSLQALLREVNLSKGSDRIRHLADIASVLGVTSSRLQEAMLMGRTETLLSNVTGRVMANFYRRIGLTQVTNANKIGVVSGGHTAMQLWARHILEGKRGGTLFDPHGELRELGIPNAEHKAYAQWIADHDDLPTLQEITGTPMGKRWGDAIKRFVDKVVLEPTAAEKPVGAGSAVGRFVYGLMSYNYNFQRAVINPMMERRIHAVQYESERLGSKVAGSISANAKWGLYLATSVGALMAAQLPTTIVRQEIFDHDRTDEWRKDGSYWDHILGLAMQRTGLGGIADPVVNAVNGLKYDHDLSSLVLGAQGNFYIQALKDLTGKFVGASSPDTNTANYRLVRGMYELLGMPTAALSTALLPGGPLKSWFISAMGQLLTSQTASDWLAKAVVGPKGEKTNLTPEQRAMAQAQAQMSGQLPQLQAMPEFDAQGNVTYPGKTQTGTPPPSGLLSFADDFAVPVVKSLPRVAARASSWVGRLIH